MPANLFLAALPPDTRARFERHLTHVSLAHGENLDEIGHSVRYVYFPEGTLSSLVVFAESGLSVEAGMVGVEGMTGITSLLGTGRSVHKAFTQISGEAIRLDAAAFVQEYEQDIPFQRLVRRYVQYLTAQISQTALCNRAHSIEARLARWLLMTSDAVGSEHLNLTQEYLSTMLGVQRPGVTLAAQLLQKAEAIQYTRGRITIVDRPALEALSCDCYAIVREWRAQMYDGLTGHK